MTRMMLGVASLTLLAATAHAAPCRDVHGKFVKCPPPASTTTHTTATNVKTTKCRDAKGHFARCGTAGTKPA